MLLEANPGKTSHVEAKEERQQASKGRRDKIEHLLTYDLLQIFPVMEMPVLVLL